MPTKAYFENLARMSRLFAHVETNPALSARFTELAAEYDLKAEQAPDDDALTADMPLPLPAYSVGNEDRPR
jgi:hypothetical protein